MLYATDGTSDGRALEIGTDQGVRRSQERARRRGRAEVELRQFDPEAAHELRPRLRARHYHISICVDGHYPTAALTNILTRYARHRAVRHMGT